MLSEDVLKQLALPVMRRMEQLVATLPKEPRDSPLVGDEARADVANKCMAHLHHNGNVLRTMCVVSMHNKLLSAEQKDKRLALRVTVGYDECLATDMLATHKLEDRILMQPMEECADYPAGSVVLDLDIALSLRSIIRARCFLMEKTEAITGTKPAVPCTNCGIWRGPKSVKKCSKCGAARYCGKACQLADWPRHKHQCK